MQRRTLYLMAAAAIIIAVGALLMKNFNRPTGAATTTMPSGGSYQADSRNAGNSTSSRDERFGATTYNTPQVAEEMRYIEAHVTPTAGPKKRILITGSTAGLGELTAYYLAKRGHTVVAHARNEARAADVRRDIPEIKDVVIGDLEDLSQTKKLAESINRLGTFDVIIYNAGVYGAAPQTMLHVNSLSSYILTCQVNKPKQLVYLTSDLHLSGQR